MKKIVSNYLPSVLVGLLLCLISTQIAADSLGQVANNLMGPIQGLGRIVNAICFIAGVGFLLGGIVQYRYHRENPQQVRLSTPLVLLFLGICLVAFGNASKIATCHTRKSFAPSW